MSSGVPRRISDWRWAICSGIQLVGIPRGVLGRVEAVPVAVDPTGQQVAVGQRGPGGVAAIGMEEPADVERERRVVGVLAVAGEGVAVSADGRLDTVEEPTVLSGPLLVGLRVRAGVHAVPVAQRGGSVDGVGVVAAEHDRRASGPVRLGTDDEAMTLVVAAFVVDSSARPRLTADLDQLDRAPDALAAMPAEAFELDVPVAESEPDHAATTRQDVEEGPVLGHPDRVVQRRQGEPESDRDPRRRLDHRCGVRGNRSDEPGVVEMVLADPHAVEPDLLGEDDLVDRLPERLAMIEARIWMPLPREDAEAQLNHRGGE